MNTSKSMLCMISIHEDVDDEPEVVPLEDVAPKKKRRKRTGPKSVKRDRRQKKKW